MSQQMDGYQRELPKDKLSSWAFAMSYSMDIAFAVWLEKIEKRKPAHAHLDYTPEL